jgi:hypothetical protein
MLKRARRAAAMRSCRAVPGAGSARAAAMRMNWNNRFAGDPPAVFGASPTTALGRKIRTSRPWRRPAQRTAVSASSLTRS